MKRIGPDEVIAAYKAKGLKARTCHISPGHAESCCAIGAVLAASGAVTEDLEAMSFDDIGNLMGLSKMYMRSFMGGFDSGEKSFPHRGEENELGRQDGMAARAAVTKAGIWKIGESK